MGTGLMVIPGQDIQSRDHRCRSLGVQCSRIKRDGARCRQWAIKGGTVCYRHGGQLPVVRAAANARLRGLLPQALAVLEASLEFEDVPDKISLRASAQVLRLNGITDTAPRRKRGRMSSTQRELERGDAATDVEIERLIAQAARQPALEPGAPS